MDFTGSEEIRVTSLNGIRSSNGMNINCGKDIFILTVWVRAKTFNLDLVRKLLPPKESTNVLLLPEVKEELIMKRALDIKAQFWSLKMMDAICEKKISVIGLVFGLSFCQSCSLRQVMMMIIVNFPWQRK